MGSLKHFIKDVKDASTPKKERDIINKESAKIRTRLKDDSVQGERRRTYTSKLLYLYILGENTSFGQVDCINLLSKSSSSVSTLNYEGGIDFENKRLGYLAASILLKDDNQELLTLITNVISQDINNSNKYIAGLALETLGSLADRDLARDLCTDLITLIKQCVDKVSSIDNLLTNSSGTSNYLIKHALVAASSLIRKDPNLMVHFFSSENHTFLADIFTTFFNEDGSVKKTGTTHGLLLSLLDFVQTCFQYKKDYDFDNNYDLMIKKSIVGPLTESFISFLENLSLIVTSADYDVNGVTDPFLQCSLLETLREIFISYGNDVGENVHSKFKQCLLRIMNHQGLPDLQTVSNSGKKSSIPKLSLSVKYESIKTIIMVGSLDSSLKSLAVDVLIKFLSSRDPNHKYVAMKTLSKGIQYMDKLDEKNLKFILSCMYESDFSIKRRSLAVIFEILQNKKLANQEVILNQVIEFLSQATSSDKELVNYCFVKLLETKVLESVENIKYLTRAILYCGFYLKNEQISEIMTVINNLQSQVSAEFIKELINLLFSNDITKEDKIFFESNFAFKVLSIWCIGEYGSFILETLSKNNPAPVSNKIVTYFDKISNDYYNPIANEKSSYIINYLIVAAAKVSTYFMDKALIERLRQLIIVYAGKTNNLVLSIKANQLLSLFSQPTDTKRKIFAKMPSAMQTTDIFKAPNVKNSITESSNQVDLLTNLFSENIGMIKDKQTSKVPDGCVEIFANKNLKMFYGTSLHLTQNKHEANLEVYYQNIGDNDISDLHSFVAVGKTQNVIVGHLSNTNIKPNMIEKQQFKITGEGHLMTRIKIQYKVQNISNVEQFDYKFDKNI
ncbi:hypothetical protein ACO0R3_001955 [Hanseniaspora guilliermondii]